MLCLKSLRSRWVVKEPHGAEIINKKPKICQFFSSVFINNYSNILNVFNHVNTPTAGKIRLKLVYLIWWTENKLMKNLLFPKNTFQSWYLIKHNSNSLLLFLSDWGKNCLVLGTRTRKMWTKWNFYELIPIFYKAKIFSLIVSFVKFFIINVNLKFNFVAYTLKRKKIAYDQIKSK